GLRRARRARRGRQSLDVLGDQRRELTAKAPRAPTQRSTTETQRTQSTALFRARSAREKHFFSVVSMPLWLISPLPRRPWRLGGLFLPPEAVDPPREVVGWVACERDALAGRGVREAEEASVQREPRGTVLQAEQAL